MDVDNSKRDRRHSPTAPSVRKDTIGPVTVQTSSLTNAIEEQCRRDSLALLHHLAKEGHKASLSKLQWVQTQVTFLGHILTSQGRTLSPQRIEAIIKLPKPETNDVISGDVLLLQKFHSRLLHSGCIDSW